MTEPHRSDEAPASALSVDPELEGPPTVEGPLSLQRYRKSDGRQLILYTLDRAPS